MIKRLISSVIVIALLMSYSMEIKSDSFMYGDFACELAGDVIIITGYTGTESHVDVPDNIWGLNVASIGDNAFQNGLFDTISLPETLESIGSSVFTDSNISELYIPDNVTFIGENNFVGCQYLETIYIGAGLPDTAHEFNFRNLPGIQNFIVNASNPYYTTENGVLFNSTRETLLVYPSSRSGAYSVPDGTIVIADSAFANASYTTAVSIPGTVESIHLNNFYDCASLTDITVDVSNANYKDIDGVLFDKYGSYLMKYPEGRQEYRYSVPDNVYTIASNAFKYSSYLSRVDIPSTVVSIGDRAFYGSANLVHAFFAGSPPNSFGSEVFHQTDENFMIYNLEIYYLWTNPWMGYTTAYYTEEGEDPNPPEPGYTVLQNDWSVFRGEAGVGEYNVLEFRNFENLISDPQVMKNPQIPSELSTSFSYRSYVSPYGFLDRQGQDADIRELHFGVEQLDDPNDPYSSNYSFNLSEVLYNDTRQGPAWYYLEDSGQGYQELEYASDNRWDIQDEASYGIRYMGVYSDDNILNRELSEFIVRAGQNHSVAVAWKAYRDGTANIGEWDYSSYTGEYFEYYKCAGVQVNVYKNQDLLFQAVTTTDNNLYNGESVEVQQGDIIYFVVTPDTSEVFPISVCVDDIYLELEYEGTDPAADEYDPYYIFDFVFDHEGVSLNANGETSLLITSEDEAYKVDYSNSQPEGYIDNLDSLWNLFRFSYHEDGDHGVLDAWMNNVRILDSYVLNERIISNTRFVIGASNIYPGETHAIANIFFTDNSDQMHEYFGFTDIVEPPEPEEPEFPDWALYENSLRISFLSRLPQGPQWYYYYKQDGNLIEAERLIDQNMFAVPYTYDGFVTFFDGPAIAMSMLGTGDKQLVLGWKSSGTGDIFLDEWSFTPRNAYDQAIENFEVSVFLRDELLFQKISSTDRDRNRIASRIINVSEDDMIYFVFDIFEADINGETIHADLSEIDIWTSWLQEGYVEEIQYYEMPTYDGSALVEQEDIFADTVQSSQEQGPLWYYLYSQNSGEYQELGYINSMWMIPDMSFKSFIMPNGAIIGTAPDTRTIIGWKSDVEAAVCINEWNFSSYSDYGSATLISGVKVSVYKNNELLYEDITSVNFEDNIFPETEVSVVDGDMIYFVMDRYETDLSYYSILFSYADISVTKPVFPDPPVEFDYQVVDDEYIKITRYKASYDLVSIPSMIEGLPVRQLGENSFNNTQVRIVHVPETVEMIDRTAFKECDKLESIFVNDGNNNFCDVDGVLFSNDMTEIIQFPTTRTGRYVIPDGVLRVGDNAFYSAYSLTEIILPETLEIIGDNSFFNSNGLGDLRLPEGVVNIGDGAFAQSSIYSVAIPDSVNYIGSLAFDSCGLLIQILVGMNNQCYSSIAGVLFDKNKETLIKYPQLRKGSYVVPDGVNVIEERAFYSSSYLSRVTFPDSLTLIKSDAFTRCNSISEFVFEGDTPSVEGEETFCDISPDTKVLYYPDKLGWTDRWHSFDTDIYFGVEEISLSHISDNNFKLEIENHTPDSSYQVWVYREVELYKIPDTGVTESQYTVNQWFLLEMYKTGNLWNNEAGKINGIYEINSPDSLGNYTVMVRVKRQSGEVITLYDTYTPEQTGLLRITSILVDGNEYNDGDHRLVREITDGASVQFDFQSNYPDNNEFEVRLQPGNMIIGNESSFNWILDKNTMPGNYRAEIKASAEGKTHTRNVNFQLFRVESDIVYGEVQGMEPDDPYEENGDLIIKLMPDIPENLLEETLFVKYSISEPWRNTIYRSPDMQATNELVVLNDTGLKDNNYGIYQLKFALYRDLNLPADDGIHKTITHLREGINKAEAYINGSEDPVNGVVPVQAGNNTLIEGKAILGGGSVLAEDIRYSFWRRDASGWRIIREYSSDSTLNWVPMMIGSYTIQIRAKGPGAMSYEAIHNIDFNVSGEGETASVSSISLDGHQNALSRMPSNLIVTAASDSDEGMMYKFVISNGYIFYVETAYSLSNRYTWLPTKAGSYSISVFIKSLDSFGIYDRKETYTVEVRPVE